MNYRSYNNTSNILLIIFLILVLFGGINLIFLSLGLFFVLLFKFFPILVVGYLLYRVAQSFSKNHRLNHYVQQSTLEHTKFVELLVKVLVKVAKADGKVDQRELDIITSFFQFNLQYDQVKMVWIRDLIHYARETDYSMNDIASVMSSEFQYQSRLILLQLVYRVALADGVFSQSEKTLVDDLVARLGISHMDHERIKALFQVHEDDDAHYYTILGVSKEATPEEIKAAYKEAVKENHPDKVAHLGSEFVKVAEEKMRKINEAFSVLKKKFS